MQMLGFWDSSRTGDVGNNNWQPCDFYHLGKSEYNVTSFNILIIYCYPNIKDKNLIIETLVDLWLKKNVTLAQI